MPEQFGQRPHQHLKVRPEHSSAGPGVLGQGCLVGNPAAVGEFDIDVAERSISGEVSSEHPQPADEHRFVGVGVVGAPVPPALRRAGPRFFC